MSILLYRKANYMDDNPINISTYKLNEKHTINKYIHSIRNDSNFYLLLNFTEGTLYTNNSTYCIAPRESHPIIFTNSTYVSTVLITAKSLQCDNSTNKNKIHDKRRLQITKDISGANIDKINDPEERRSQTTKNIEKVMSDEYKTFNKGWLVLYSKPYYDSSGDVKVVKLTLNSTVKIDMVVKSVINLTREFYLIYNTSNLDKNSKIIFIRGVDVLSNPDTDESIAETYAPNLIHYDMKMYRVTAVNQEYYRQYANNYFKNPSITQKDYNVLGSYRYTPSSPIPFYTPYNSDYGEQWKADGDLPYLHPWDDSMAQLVPELLPMEDTELLQEPETVWFSIYTTLLSVLCIILFVWLISPTAKATAKYLRRYREKQLIEG